MAKHEVHTSPDGKHQWTQEGGHCRCGGGHALTPVHDICPQELAPVVLRCRCDDPMSHAVNNEHCPQAEIDVAATYEASVSFTPVVTQ